MWEATRRQSEQLQVCVVLVIYLLFVISDEAFVFEWVMNARAH